MGAVSLLSALIVCVVILYVFGLMFMQGIKSYLSTLDGPADLPGTSFDDLEKYYGTLLSTLWTLISAVTGGYDWNDVSEPIRETGFVYKYFFLFYVLLMTFGVLNVLTGIFVHVAMQSSVMNREIAIDEAISNRDSIVKEVIELFLEADTDGSGALSWTEFEEFIQDEKIKAFFMSLELDISSCSRIFHLLDASGDGVLEAHEFVEGCIELRGMARKADITLLQRENAALSDKLEAATKDMSTEIARLCQDLVAKQPQPPPPQWVKPVGNLPLPLRAAAKQGQ